MKPTQRDRFWAHRDSRPALTLLRCFSWVLLVVNLRAAMQKLRGSTPDDYCNDSVKHRSSCAIAQAKSACGPTGRQPGLIFVNDVDDQEAVLKRQRQTKVQQSRELKTLRFMTAQTAVLTMS